MLPCALHFIQRGVHSAQRVLVRVAIPAESDARADGNPHRHIRYEDRAVVDLLNLLLDGLHVAQMNSIHPDDEFVAAEMRKEVVRANALVNLRHKVLQRSIAKVMAIIVVDPLEIVHVDHPQRSVGA